MYFILLKVACFLLIATADVCRAADADYYTAGVVEFSDFVNDGENTFNARLETFLSIINSTEAKSTDILAFPESALNNNILTFVPAANENIIPCMQSTNALGDQYEPFLSKLSCAARDAAKYLVVNLREKENCSRAAITNKDTRGCALNDLNTYNTNVVFDRQGKVISRYRKFNLYVEPHNQTLVPDYGIFDTDFGVRFGHFICFDINFYQPTQQLVKDFGIQNFILTIHFISELPFLTAVQLQQAWAWGNNVNLLAAGASFPAIGTTGSGIFSGAAGALQALMTGEESVRKLLIAKVPKVPGNIVNKQTHENAMPQTAVGLLKDPEIENFNSEIINTMQANNISREICAGAHCCQFHISTAAINTSVDSVWYQYRMGVFNGRRSYQKEVYSDLLVCAVYACTNSNASSCGEILKYNEQKVLPNFVFKSIHITGDFEHAEQMLLMPNSVDVGLYPLATHLSDWSVASKNNKHSVSFKLNSEVNDLLSFGIYGNYYLRSAADCLSTLFLLYSFCLFFALINF